MDAAVAAAFGFVLHLKSNLRQDRNKFVSVLALLGTVSSSLGLAIGAMCPTGYYYYIIIILLLLYYYYLRRCCISGWPCLNGSICNNG